MTAPMVPIILVGGAVYVLQTQGPPSPIPILPSINTVGAPPATPSYGDAVVPDAQSKVDLMLSAVAGKFATMNSAEKVNAASTLNAQLGLSPPLTGAEDWDTIAGRAAGSAASGLCDQIPGIGAAAGPLCAIAGTYLGVTLSSWMTGDLSSAKDWVVKNIGGAVAGLLDDAESWLSDVI